jgi:hypothetical protein
MFIYLRIFSCFQDIHVFDPKIENEKKNDKGFVYVLPVFHNVSVALDIFAFLPFCP